MFNLTRLSAMAKASMTRPVAVMMNPNLSSSLQRLLPSFGPGVLDGSRAMSIRTGPTVGVTPPGEKYFDKILIANRGEIACRVIKTCRRLGIKTVAVYSEPDQYAKHVRMADEAYCIGPAPSNQSYLVVEKIVDVIKKTGAQAVHPGYGFLSESSKFSKALEDIGVQFIGPNAKSIFAMGDKIESKRHAVAAKVNIIPGFVGEVHNETEALRICNEIGYPVMVKASGGGGGKGMRVAWNDQEASEGFRLSKSEAMASFGDDRMLVERFVDGSRHIEIQIIGDKFGNVFYLPERECSIQRRNQKILEEAPSTFIDPATRKMMGEQAVALAKAVGYFSAGTVEMLVDNRRNFYFLEMNTRLQVEHPVSELIAGVDLVEQMIRVAAGKPLNFKQEDLKIQGWAMESRVYAEDPFRNFLPSIGTLKTYREPTSQDPDNLLVRVDSGVTEGSEISIHYDPMISKLITYGKDRATAIKGQIEALDSYVIRGLAGNNISFLRAMMVHPSYVSGDISTKFIPTYYPKGFHGYDLSADERRELIAATAALRVQKARAAYVPNQLLPGHSVPSEFNFVIGVEDRVVQGGTPEQAEMVAIVARWCDKIAGVVVDFPAGADGQTHSVKLANVQVPDQYLIQSKVNGERDLFIQVQKDTPTENVMQYAGTNFNVHIRTPAQQQLWKHMPIVERVDTSKVIMSPMPGSVTSVAVKPGDLVVIGQEIACVSAMKMQNVLRSQRDGKVKEVLVKAADNVNADQILVVFEDAPK